MPNAKQFLRASDLAFEPEDDWAKLPPGWSFPDVAGVAVDKSDNVYALNRSDHPVCVFDKEGTFLRSFGEGFLSQGVHGIHYGVDDFVYCIDYSHHAIHRFTPEGKLVWTLGEQGKPAPKWSGKPFNMPTHIAVSPRTGDLFVTDGYGNCRVHRYAADGRHIVSWGQPGCEPGEFQAPHNVVVDADENVFVADRENNRVQVFDGRGRVQAIWHDIYRPDGMCMDNAGLIYIGELLGQVGLEDCPTLGHRIGVYTKDGKRLARLGDPDLGDGPGQFIAPHGLATDSRGNLYVGEVSFGMKGRFEDPPRTYRNFRRLRRLR